MSHRHHADRSVDNVQTPFRRTKRHEAVPAPEDNESGEKNLQGLPPQVMSTPQPHGMNRYKTNHGKQNKQERRPE